MLLDVHFTKRNKAACREISQTMSVFTILNSLVEVIPFCQKNLNCNLLLSR